MKYSGQGACKYFRNTPDRETKAVNMQIPKIEGLRKNARDRGIVRVSMTLDGGREGPGHAISRVRQH